MKKNYDVIRTLEKMFICSLFQRICSMLAHIGQQAPETCQRSEVITLQCCVHVIYTLSTTQPVYLFPLYLRYGLTHRVGWPAGSQEWTDVDRGSDCMQSQGPRQTRPLQPDRGPCSPPPRGQRRRHTQCCRSHRCGHTLAVASHRYPENRTHIEVHIYIILHLTSSGWSQALGTTSFEQEASIKHWAV